MTDTPRFDDAPVEITKAASFEAAHHMSLPDDPEPYRRMHGHSFRVEVTLRGRPDPKRGWVDDFGDLSAALAELVARLDHGFLNEVPGLERPTLERLCAWIARELSPRFATLARVSVSRPSLNETATLVVRQD